MFGPSKGTMVGGMPSRALLIGSPGQRGTHFSDHDENNQVWQIAEQASSVSSQASLWHLSANTGVGREWLVMANRTPTDTSRWSVTGSKRPATAVRPNVTAMVGCNLERPFARRLGRQVVGRYGRSVIGLGAGVRYFTAVSTRGIELSSVSFPDKGNSSAKFDCNGGFSVIVE